MAEALRGARLTEAVVAALRLASARRGATPRLTTFEILLALEAVDTGGGWSRFLIDERPQGDPTPTSADTWEGVPLSGEAATALTLARRIAETYDLGPMPPGVLAIALVWDRDSGAARAFPGTDHDQLIVDLQDDVLGTQLEGLDRIDQIDREPGRGLDDPPEVSDEEAHRALRVVIPRLPAWILRALAVAAAAAVWFSLTTAPAWQFEAEDDLLPPVDRPSLAEAIPSTDSLGALLALELVRDHDGLPRLQLFDSTLPSAWDIRQEVLDGAWAGHWESTDGRAEVIVQLASTRYDYDRVGSVTRFISNCTPSGSAPVSDVVDRAGYEARDADSAIYCSLSRSGQTQIFIGVATFKPELIPELPDRVAAALTSVETALPAPSADLTTRTTTPYGTAQIRKAWLSAILLVPILWLLPTLLMDRAFWQRVRWSLLLRRLWSFPHPGIDIDAVVRGRLWSSALMACLQALVGTWVLRACWSWEGWSGLVRAVAGRVGWHVAGALDLALALTCALAIGQLPRLLHRRRAPGTGAFAGRRRLLWIAGLAFSLLALAGAYVAMMMGTAVGAIGVGGSSDFAQERMSTVLRFAAVPLVLVALTPMMLVRRLAMRALRTREANDDRPPILLLRSFADDGIKVRARGNQRRSLIDRLSLRRWERFEEVIAAALAVQGPVLGVGQVGERLPPALGAVRRQFTHEEWQDRVYDLMAQASLICVTLGRTESLAWEIRRIADAGYLGKTVFVLPPTTRDEHLKRLAVLADILALGWVDLNVGPSGGWALAVRVEAPGAVPQVIRARAQEDVGYDVALEMMRLAIGGWSWATDSLADEFESTPPRAQIHPQGRAPRKRSWWRRPWLLIVMVNVTGVLALPIVFLTGEEAETVAVLELGSSTAWDVAADVTTGDMYAIIDGEAIVRVSAEGDEPPELDVRPVARIDRADSLVAEDGWFFAANHAEGTLQGISPGSGSVTWRRDDLPGLRGVVVLGDRVYVALPSQRRVLAVDRATGEDVVQAPIDGIPWSLAVQSGTLSVALGDREGVVRLAADDLGVVGELGTDAPATTVVSANGDLWAYYPSGHLLEAIDGPGTGVRIATRSEAPALASNGTSLAIGGVEMVTTLRPSGELHRNRYLLRHPAELAVTRSGDLLALTDNMLVFIRASAD